MSADGDVRIRTHDLLCPLFNTARHDRRHPDCRCRFIEMVRDNEDARISERFSKRVRALTADSPEARSIRARVLDMLEEIA